MPRARRYRQLGYHQDGRALTNHLIESYQQPAQSSGYLERLPFLTPEP